MKFRDLQKWTGRPPPAPPPPHAGSPDSGTDTEAYLSHLKLWWSPRASAKACAPVSPTSLPQNLKRSAEATDSVREDVPCALDRPCVLQRLLPLHGPPEGSTRPPIPERPQWGSWLQPGGPASVVRRDGQTFPSDFSAASRQTYRTAGAHPAHTLGDGELTPCGNPHGCDVFHDI